MTFIDRVHLSHRNHQFFRSSSWQISWRRFKPKEIAMRIGKKLTASVKPTRIVLKKSRKSTTGTVRAGLPFISFSCQSLNPIPCWRFAKREVHKLNNGSTCQRLRGHIVVSNRRSLPRSYQVRSRYSGKGREKSAHKLYLSSFLQGPRQTSFRTWKTLPFLLKMTFNSNSSIENSELILHLDLF